MIRRIAGVLAALMVGAAGLALAAPAAHAQSLGTVVVIPGDSIDLTPIRLRTSAGCPQQADAYYARMTGQGFPDGVLVTTNTSAGLSHTTGFDVYFAQTMRDFADLAGGVTLGGRYDIAVHCIDSFALTSFGEFTGSLEFRTPTAYSAIGTARPVGPPPEPLRIGGDGAGVDLAVPQAPALGPAAAGGGVRPASSSDPDGPSVLPLVLIAVLVTVPVGWLVAFRVSRGRSS